MEEHRILGHNSNTLPQAVETDGIYWVTSQIDAARIRLEKPGDWETLVQILLAIVVPVE